jgi:osomolarity two-component system sensor histidine kinase SLN1
MLTVSRLQGLTLVASLKAAQVTSDLQLLQSTCATIVTRILIQSALQRFYQGNNTDTNWARATVDVQSALASGGYSALLQVIIYPRNATGNVNGLLNVTGSAIKPIKLPYSYANGTVSCSNIVDDVGIWKLIDSGCYAG